MSTAASHLPHEALELLLGACGTQFDQEMVQLFLRTIAIYPVGMIVGCDV